MRRTTHVITSIQYLSGSAAELRGRQSVRTTFKLSERAIGALSILSNQLGIKQKTLFDHIVDDEAVLNNIAEQADELPVRKHRIAKTFVVSRKTLESLEKVSTRFQVPRDVLVEFSIERIMPLIEQEKEKHKRRKELHSQMMELFEKGREVLSSQSSLFDEDDPVFDRYVCSLRAFGKGVGEVEKFVERSRKVEDF